MAFVAPEAILGGAELLAIAGVVLMLGLLFSAKALVQVLFSPLNIGIYLVGHPFSSIVSSVENSLLGWLDGAIATNQQALAELFSGLVWLVQQTGAAIEDTAHYTEQALDHLATITVPGQIEAALHDTSVVAHGASSSVTALAHTVTNDVNTLEGKITHAITASEDYADAKVHATEVHFLNTVADTALSINHDLNAAIAGVESTLGKRISKLEGAASDQAAAASAVATKIVNDALAGVEGELGALRTKVDSAATTANGAVSAAIAAARTEVNADIGAVLAQAQQAVQTATSAASTAAADALRQAEIDIGRVEATATAGATDALAQARAAVGALAGEIDGLVANLPTTIEQELAKFTPASVATLLAEVTGVAATLSLVMAESGLDSSSCRAKNKNICGVPSARWEQLLLSLAFAFEWPGLEAFAEGIADLAGGIVDDIETLATG